MDSGHGDGDGGIELKKNPENRMANLGTRYRFHKGRDFLCDFGKTHSTV